MEKTAMLLIRSGVLLDPLNLNPYLISCADVAGSLSKQCRYNGHLRTWYSVAQHSIAMSRYAEKWFPHIDYLDFACLMHDAHEMITGDIPYPVKKCIPEISLYEEELLSLFFKRFKIPYDEKILSYVKKLDKDIVDTEIGLFFFEDMVTENIDKEWEETIGWSMSVEEAEKEFMLQFAKMYDKYFIKEEE